MSLNISLKKILILELFLSSWLSKDKLGPDKSLRENLGVDIFESILLIKETRFLAYMTFEDQFTVKC